MAHAYSKERILKDYNNSLKRKRQSEIRLKKANFLNNQRQRRAPDKLQEKLFRTAMEQAGIDRELFLQQQAKDRTARKAFRSQQQKLIAQKVAETAKLHRALRKDMSRRHKFVRKLSGHSPYLGCVTLAESIARYSDSGRRGSVDIDEYRFVFRRSSLDNAADIGGRIQTGVRDSGYLSQWLYAQFVWESDKEGIMQAQGHVQVNGDFDLGAVWGWYSNAAEIHLRVYLEAFQTGRGGLHRGVRSAPFTILDERVAGGSGNGWWGQGITSYVSDEIVVETPAMEIEAGYPVGFAVVVEATIAAENGADVTLNLAEGAREVNIPGVVFSVED